MKRRYLIRWFAVRCNSFQWENQSSNGISNENVFAHCVFHSIICSISFVKLCFALILFYSFFFILFRIKRGMKTNRNKKKLWRLYEYGVEMIVSCGCFSTTCKHFHSHFHFHFHCCCCICIRARKKRNHKPKSEKRNGKKSQSTIYIAVFVLWYLQHSHLDEGWVC